jgi:hypothetical protein
MISNVALVSLAFLVRFLCPDSQAKQVVEGALFQSCFLINTLFFSSAGFSCDSEFKRNSMQNVGVNFLSE